MPIAAAPIRSPCSAIRLRSRQVSWRIGSMPFWMRIAAAAGAAMWARALAPSVTLTASASPLSGSALAMRSAGSNDAGGVISAVMTNCPARSSCSRREAGGAAGAVMVRSDRPFAGVTEGVRWRGGTLISDCPRGPAVGLRPPFLDRAGGHR